ncbi:MBOAT family O-acyltransferase [Terriglobus aquaticus]|uniref:MBOAT family O-acyltransferase n=1 Tax=Terriglobus aquaticus TaxID=940139 RepID=A0ABW9KLK1_9BACT|nr:MBOAT family O-acyltransferase [Terriglobus aquaticus]
MLFNSYAFLFVFLPVVLLGYQVAAHWHRRAVIIWLALSSLAFYAYWSPRFLLLLVGSILFNYAAGSLIASRLEDRLPTKTVLWAAIIANLAVLCAFKYFVPWINGVTAVFHHPLNWSDLILPLGISFFTFTQIAYLVDLEQGAAHRQDLDSYVLFVTFFPHLIAGPILHHAEIMPQLHARRDFRLRSDDMAVGFAWFVMGLFKKVVLADRFSTEADRAFLVTGVLHTGGSWVGVLSYSLQLYFDFSGYSDMALGLARMFSINFPLNFSSPYKSRSIIDFWQRWHMTLTRYIMSYLYNPIAMWINRRRVRQGKKISRKATATVEGFVQLVAFPTTVTLFLAGVWHGAGLQFVIFGLLHALYLCINHGWRVWRTTRPATAAPSALVRRLRGIGSLLLTYVAVLIAQVFFRAAGVGAAMDMLAGMIGRHHGPVPLRSASLLGVNTLVGLVVGYLIVWCLPNTQQMLARFKPSLQLAPSDLQPSLVRIAWRPTPAWGFVLGAVLLLVLVRMQVPSTFLYFQF